MNNLFKDYCNQQWQQTPNIWLTLLHIGSEYTEIFSNNNQDSEFKFQLKIGYTSLSKKYFANGITPFAIENAIIEIEDEIMLLARSLPPSSILLSQDNQIQQIALLSDIPLSQTMILSIEAMEWTFNRFADIASGRPSSLDNLPFEPEFASTLLILREFMHHLNFTQIVIK